MNIVKFKQSLILEHFPQKETKPQETQPRLKKPAMVKSRACPAACESELISAPNNLENILFKIIAAGDSTKFG